MKSLKLENQALLKKKEGSKFLSDLILKTISSLNYILKKMSCDFHSLSINYIIYTEKMYYKVITIINNDFFLRAVNYRFLACCIFSVFMTRKKIGKEKLD